MALFPAELDHFEIILASKSPRRQQLLKDLGVQFKVITQDIEETFPSHLKKEEVALYLALKKATAFEGVLHQENLIVITADTIVCLGEKIIGKPNGYLDAINTLKSLSGKMHEVFTGVCIRLKEKKNLFFVRSEVYFKTLSDDEIHFYLEHFKPYDKAGAYGIQDWIGLIGIEKINGSYHNVMGLPVKEVYESLLEISKNRN
jgi:septum formation protein